MKKINAITIYALFLAACMAYSAGAGVPKIISMQGKLMENGAAANGTKNLEYCFAAMGENLDWKNTAVKLENGIFNASLPVPDGVTFEKSYNLLLKFAGQNQPYLQDFSSVPYAFYAQNAEKLGGLTATAYATKDAQGNLIGVKTGYVKKTGDAMDGALSVGTGAKKISGKTAIESYSDIRGIFGMGLTEYGVRGNSAATAGKLQGAVVGENSQSGFGVCGYSEYGTGIAGYNGGYTTDPEKTGVFGSGDLYGVRGLGVGTGGSFTGTNGTGVYGAGKNYGGDFSCSYGSLALQGRSTGEASYGVGGEGVAVGGTFECSDSTGAYGGSTGGTGVYGQSDGGIGVRSETSAPDKAGAYAENLGKGPALKVEGPIVGSGTTEPESASNALVMGSGKTNYDVIVNNDLKVKKKLKVQGNVEIKGDLKTGNVGGNLDGLTFKTYKIPALNGMWGGQSVSVNAPELKGKEIFLLDLNERWSYKAPSGGAINGDQFLITGGIMSFGVPSCDNKKGVIEVFYPGEASNQYSFHMICVTAGYK